jgi:hypothetical protein
MGGSFAKAYQKNSKKSTARAINASLASFFSGLAAAMQWRARTQTKKVITVEGLANSIE